MVYFRCKTSSTKSSMNKFFFLKQVSTYSEYCKIYSKRAKIVLCFRERIQKSSNFSSTNVQESCSSFLSVDFFQITTFRDILRNTESDEGKINSI